MSLNAVLRGIEKPDQETLAQFNGAAIQAARELSNQAAHTILGCVTAGKPQGGDDTARGNGHLQKRAAFEVEAVKRNARNGTADPNAQAVPIR
jgi:hypothetical protein